MLNRVFLIGNLVRDPEVRYTAQGTCICKFRLAVNSTFKDHPATFVDINAWAKLGETCGEYLSKGRQCLIEGRLTQENWETQDGSKRSKITVTAENVRFLSPRNGHEYENGSTPVHAGSVEASNGTPDPDDDIDF